MARVVLRRMVRERRRKEGREGGRAGGREGGRTLHSGYLHTTVGENSPSLPPSHPPIPGTFSSGGLLGYADLLRQTAKPMYKRNRVVLGGDPQDESKVRRERGGEGGKEGGREGGLNRFFLKK